MTEAICLCQKNSKNLRCCIEHILNEDAISGGRIVNKDMSNGADELAVLDDGGATRPLPVAEEGRGASGSGR